MTFMSNILSKTGLGALAIGGALAFSPVMAEAATLSLLGASDGAVRALADTGGTADFDLDDSGNQAPGWSQAAYDALVPAGTGRSGDSVTVFDNTNKTAANGVSVDMRSTITFTYLGSEAGFTNLGVELIGDTIVFRNSGPATNFGATFSFDFGPGLIPFAFETLGNGGATVANNGGVDPFGTQLEIAYSAIFNSGTSINVFFGDSGAGIDGDLDDLGIRIDVAPVPLPAGGLLLLTALGGVAALRRKRKAA